MERKSKNRRKYVGIAIILLMVMCLGMPMLNVVTSAPIMNETFAVINTAQDGAWNAGATWVGGTPPATGDDAVILDTHDITLPANTLTGSCEIQTGGTLDGGDGYVLTCDEENGAGFSFDNDGTISSLSLTFTYAGATDVDLNGAVAGNPTNVVCNHADLNVTQTTTATMTTLTITAGSWDCNDEDLTVIGAVDVDDELVGGASLIRIGGYTNFTDGSFARETSTVQFTNTLSVDQQSGFFNNVIIDDSVTVTVLPPGNFVCYGTLTVDGTTGGGLTGSTIVRPGYTSTHTQSFFCGANAVIDCPMTIDIADGETTRFDGCAFDDVTLGQSTSATFTLTNRSMTCVDFTMVGANFNAEYFDTSTFDFHSTGTFSMSGGGPSAVTEFDAQSNDIIFAGGTTFGTNSQFYGDSANVYITDDFTVGLATGMDWNYSTVIINGTAQQTIDVADGFPFHNLTINNTHASESVIFVSDLDVDGNLTLTNGQIDLETNSADIYTSRNVTISNTTTILFSPGTWYFNGNTSYTDNNATAQNIGDIYVSGELYLLTDCHVENITVNETGTLDMTSNQILTVNGNTTFNTTSTFNRGNSIWNMNGTINQTITASGLPFWRINVNNTNGIVAFVNDTNITQLELFANTTMVLQDNMTVGVLYCSGIVGGRVNVSSNNTSVERFLFNPLSQRYINYTDFNNVTLVPTPPEIYNVTDQPDPQEYAGYVNITCDVTDDFNVSTVWVNITGIGNFSMSQGTDDEWYYNNTYSQLGTFDYVIKANDTHDCWNSSTTYNFTIQDTTNPVITNITITPTAPETEGYVNITAEITDNVGIQGVWLNITYPNSTYQNVSMIFIGSDTWFYNQTYNYSGDYSFVIWTNDTSDNWKSATDEFTMTTPPMVLLQQILVSVIAIVIVVVLFSIVINIIKGGISGKGEEGFFSEGGK